jgi:hypothetical protein
MKIPQLLLKLKFGTNLTFSGSSTCRSKSTSMLLVKIGCTVKKLLKGLVFMKILQLLPQNEIWNIFEVLIFLHLLSWIDRYTASEKRFS